MVKGEKNKWIRKSIEVQYQINKFYDSKNYKTKIVL